MTTELFSSTDGRQIPLRQELARGGEGIIYLIGLDTPAVAKVYLSQPQPDKVAKLRAMLRVGDLALRNVTAWPQEVLLDSAKKVRGFLMPRISSNADIHKLYSPKSRTNDFPQADFRFLLHVASNLCRAFGTVHSNQQVIGDINHGSTLVAPDGRVTLIDTDSFEIHCSGDVFPCDVASPLFAAPELQDISNFRGVIRTQSQDNFGLAVLLFHLLFMGRHPFAGVPTVSKDISIEQAIRERQFPYSAQCARRGLAQPPGTLPLETFGSEIASYFEKAFITNNRPTAEEWLASIRKLSQSLKQCQQSTTHVYLNSLTTCPWCVLEHSTGARLFGFRLEAPQTGAVDIATLWRAIEQAPRPSPDPQLPDESGHPVIVRNGPKSNIKLWQRATAIGCIGAGLAACATGGFSNGLGVGGLVMFAISALVWPRINQEELEKIDTKLNAARTNWNILKQRWNSEASIKLFESEALSLKETYRQLNGLTEERRKKLALLDARRQEDQKRRYLDRFRIDQARIPGIGQSRAAKLASCGIETADDVGPKITAIPGFGPTLCAELFAWRQKHEANFRFVPSEPINPNDVARLDSELAARRNVILARLRSGPSNLSRLNKEIVAARTRLMPLLTSAWVTIKALEEDRSTL